ncbi:MAG: gliding motility lipoprotein GldH [Bacteroidales bacterium]|nr:gliding motility lipoprotein GldH [Bacteroidales bacterium]
MIKVRIAIGLVLISMMTVSCHRGYYFESVVTLPVEGWVSEDFVSFEVMVDDTIGDYYIDIFIRNDGRYAYSNLFLFINTLAPTGAQIQDTIECRLADKSGKWLGRGIGGQYSFVIPYKNRVRFPYKGLYRFEIEQGMREDPLLFITDIGISIKAGE